MFISSQGLKNGDQLFVTASVAPPRPRVPEPTPPVVTQDSFDYNADAFNDSSYLGLSGTKSTPDKSNVEIVSLGEGELVQRVR